MGRAELIQPVSPQIGSEQNISSVAFRGTAVFSNDKLVGWLEDNETKGLLFIIGKSRRGVVPVSMGKGRPTVSVLMQKAESQIKPELADDKLRVTVKIKAEGSMEEEGKNRELATLEGLKELQQVFAKQVEEICKKSVAKAQQYKNEL